MKITIYTVNDCKFSGEEKAYLQSKGLQFEEKNLETNRDFLTEMLQKSNNFAGTPVTEIVKDDGTSMVIKGFTQNEFDAAIGGTTMAAAPAMDTTQPEPAVAPVSEPMPAPVMPAPVEEPAMPQTNEAASAMSIPDPIPPVDKTPIAPPIMSNPEPTVNTQPTMPDVVAGQVLSDSISAPVATPPLVPEPGPIESISPVATMPTDPMAMPQAPVQPAEQAQNNPLNSVLNDLQSKANS
jgi:glutaredoxin